jgi:hypothetical protein
LSQSDPAMQTPSLPSVMNTLQWASRFLLFSLTDAYQTGEAYFMVVFGSDQPDDRGRRVHTWATFIRACGEGPHMETYALEWRTISWWPRRPGAAVHGLLPVSGVNLDLECTLQRVLSQRARVCQWGPFRVEEELDERARRQIARLESGAVRYHEKDSASPPLRVSNSIHAVSDLAEGYGRLKVEGSTGGEMTSRRIVGVLRPWIINPQEAHRWLEAPLGLLDYPIERCDLDPGDAADSRKAFYFRQRTVNPSSSA